MTIVQCIAMAVTIGAAVWVFEASRLGRERQALIAMGILIVAALIAGGPE